MMMLISEKAEDTKGHHFKLIGAYVLW